MARLVTLSVEVNVPVVPETPTDELSAPVVFNAPDMTVELAVAFLIVSPARSVNWVVLAPPRNRATALDGVVSTPAAEIVVLAVAPKVETPVAPSVPLVKMFVLIVVAAWAMPALTKITARDRTTARVTLPKPFKYDLMLFIIMSVFY